MSSLGSFQHWELRLLLWIVLGHSEFVISFSWCRVRRQIQKTVPGYPFLKMYDRVVHLFSEFYIVESSMAIYCVLEQVNWSQSMFIFVFRGTDMRLIFFVDGLLSCCYALVKKSLLVQVSLYTPLTHRNNVTSFAAGRAYVWSDIFSRIVVTWDFRFAIVRSKFSML